MAHPMAMPQFDDAVFPATGKRARPIMATAGAIVKGVMYCSTAPIMPRFKLSFELIESTMII